MPEDTNEFSDDDAGVTWETYVELGKPAGVTVFPGGPSADSKGYVCSSYALGDPFLMPGNRVGKCAICGQPIQMRPHAPESIRKICVPCALMNGLKMPVISKAAR